MDKKTGSSTGFFALTLAGIHSLVHAALGTLRAVSDCRLHVFPLEVPPLRARSSDVPLLVEYFIDRYARKAGKNIGSVDTKTLQLIESYPWLGNIRELQNVIERSLIVCETDTLQTKVACPTS